MRATCATTSGCAAGRSPDKHHRAFVKAIRQGRIEVAQEA
jgi:hypothetical protein